MSGKNSAARVKDVLTEHISRDIKAVGGVHRERKEEFLCKYIACLL